MKLPCPVPLQNPWSPVGYRVVEVADETSPGAEAGPRTGRATGAAFPSSPLGYQLVPVAEEAGPQPRPVRHHRRPAERERAYNLALALKRPRGREPGPSVPWGPIAAAGLGGIVLLFLLVMSALPDRGPPMPPQAVVQVQPVAQADIPQAAEVILPEIAPDPGEGKGQQPAEAAAVKAPPKEPALPAAEACPPAKGGGPVLERETFGTAVAFARNPAEALRQAGAEHKLAFVLHVSGNFEEARFT